MEKIAICILTRGYKNKAQYVDLIWRNRSIQKAIKSQDLGLNIDHLIFHEGNISKSHQEFIKKYSGFTGLKFIDVGCEFINNISTFSSYCYPTELSESFSVGYKSMCRFWSDRFLDYTKEYRYVARVDEDCFIKSFPLRDLIHEMKASNINYLTPKNLYEDDPNVTIGLLEMTNDFIAARKIICDTNLSLKVNPYTNVFLLDAQHYRTSKILRDFMLTTYEANGIYVNRWGDLVIWGLAMKILGENQAKMVSKKISYIHGSFGEVINGNKTLKIFLAINFFKLVKFALRKI